LAALVLLRVPGRSQGPVVTSLRGEIHSDQVLLQGYFVELFDVLNRRAVDREFVHPDGSFAFRNVPYGDYEVRVTNSGGEVVQQQFMAINGTTPPVELRLRHEVIQRPPSGPISLTQLKHPPARKAFGAFVAAQRFSEAGQYAKAAEELEKAIRISPEYAEAYTNLAAQHVRLGRYEDAVNDAKRAMELTRPNAVDLCNMAFAMHRLGRYPEAVDAARTAVRLEPGNDRAHYLLGTLLVRDWRTLREGITQLKRALQSVPAAQVNLDLAKQALAKGPPDANGQPSMNRPDAETQSKTQRKGN
jgi:tetratricopeptide (TPR) repeat protein